MQACGFCYKFITIKAQEKDIHVLEEEKKCEKYIDRFLKDGNTKNCILAIMRMENNEEFDINRLFKVIKKDGKWIIYDRPFYCCNNNICITDYLHTRQVIASYDTFMDLLKNYDIRVLIVDLENNL